MLLIFLEHYFGSNNIVLDKMFPFSFLTSILIAYIPPFLFRQTKIRRASPSRLRQQKS